QGEPGIRVGLPERRPVTSSPIFTAGHAVLLPAEIGLSGWRWGVTLLPYLVQRQPCRGRPLDPAHGLRKAVSKRIRYDISDRVCTGPSGRSRIGSGGGDGDDLRTRWI